MRELLLGARLTLAGGRTGLLRTRAFDRVERAWVDRYRDKVARTDDIIALAAQVSGRGDVVPFLRDWVYGTKTPPMLGHPDWTTNAPGTAQATAAPPRIRRR